MTNSAHERAFGAFAAFPEGLTRPEFEQLMDTDEDRRCASARLSQFVKEGLAIKAGIRENTETGQPCIVYSPSGKLFGQRLIEERDPRRKRRRPTNAELLELRRWKADAIKRFPELGTDPAILAARKSVADILRGEGNETKAGMVERGELDEGETMRIVLSVMRARTPPVSRSMVP